MRASDLPPKHTSTSDVVLVAEEFEHGGTDWLKSAIDLREVASGGVLKSLPTIEPDALIDALRSALGGDVGLMDSELVEAAAELANPFRRA